MCVFIQLSPLLSHNIWIPIFWATENPHSWLPLLQGQQHRTQLLLDTSATFQLRLLGVPAPGIPTESGRGCHRYVYIYILLIYFFFYLFIYLFIYLSIYLFMFFFFFIYSCCYVILLIFLFHLFICLFVYSFVLCYFTEGDTLLCIYFLFQIDLGIYSFMYFILCFYFCFILI